MGHETPMFVNTAIFQKLFLQFGCSSNTIMKGSVGFEDQLTPQELKIIGNRNFIEMYKETFSSLHKFTDIGVSLLKKIHKTLSKELVPNAGEFRTHDFPDRNGVTFEYKNFDREIKDIEHVLNQTGWSFDDLNTFIYDLARSYYMFIAIHPFWDSNGRVGKCFLNHLLLKKGLPPISFDTKEEIYALPRYGGSMEDMHDYLRHRINKAIAAYFYERWKLEDFGFLHKQIYNVAFDSGFYFRQIDDMPQKLEINFIAYVINKNSEKYNLLKDYCLVVFDSEELLRSMTFYCGFSKKERGKWEKEFSYKHNFFINEAPSDIADTRAFDVAFVIELHGQQHEYDYFNCCVASNGDGEIYNNKGLNYSYKMER
ncbi:Filamentation-like domain protein [Candidatus Magnetoovum chiemensis]|nr:Filamentation-like domain protein [Candidatus Magnetoovum chiemensis]